MTVYQPESFYETTLASAITAVASSVPVTIAPIITSGYLVIESNTSNKEIIKYTGVTGTTLTGCVRGLATYGSDDSAGTGKTHPAGVEIANKDVHYYSSQYYDFLTGVSATGTNTMRIGDGNTISASNRLWRIQTSSLSAFWGLSSSGQMVVSEDGITSYVVSAGGSGLTAGDGIDIIAGAIEVSYLSSGGLRISATELAVDYGQGLSATSAGELYVDPTHDYEWTGTHTHDALNTFRSSSVFQSSGTMEVNSDITFGGVATGMQLIEYYDADEVISVSSNPKPVKVTSAGRVYMISSALGISSYPASYGSSAHPYFGFAITGASAIGTQCKVQLAGIVPGFTGLTPAERYYAAAEAGEFGTEKGSAELLLGRAVAATKMLIEHGSYEYIGSVAGVASAINANVVVPDKAFWAIADINAYNSGGGFKANMTMNKDGRGNISGADYATLGASKGCSWSWGTSSISLNGGGAVSATGTVYFFTK